MEDVCVFYICYKFSNNLTENETDITFASFQTVKVSLDISIVFIILHTLTWIFSMGGNALLCYIVLTLSKRSNKHYFLMSCALSDILMSTICVPLTVLSELVYFQWPFGETLCPIIQFLQTSCVLQKSLNMLVLNYEQYYSITNTMKKLSRKTRNLLLFMTWTCPVIIAVPTVLHSTTIQLPVLRGYHEYCVEIWDREDDRKMYSLSIILFQYFIPLVLIMAFYIRIGNVIMSNKTPGEKDVLRDRKISRSKRKGITMLLLIIATFGITWLPLHILTLIGDWIPAIYNETNIHIMWIFFHWLALSNSGTNCIIYLVRNTVFREEVRRLISKATFGMIYRQSPPSPPVSIGSDNFFDKASFRRRMNSSIKRRRTEL